MKVGHADDDLLGVPAAGPPNGQQRCFVDQAFELRAVESRGLVGQPLPRDVVGHALVGDVDLEDFQPRIPTRHCNPDPAVHAAGPNQCLIEDVGPVGGRDHHQWFVVFDSVEAGQQLIERLFALVVSGTDPRTSSSPDGVQLVDEDHRGRLFHGGLEHVAHPGRSHTHEHFDELGGGDEEKLRVGLAGDRPGQQRLAAAGRSLQQHAPRQPHARVDPSLGGLEEIDQIAQQQLCLRAPADVGKGHLARLGERACATLAQLR